MDRRTFLSMMAAAAATAAATDTTAAPAPRVKAVLFDGLAVFDARPVAALAESLFPANGSRLMDAWRTRQFEYQWLRALGGQYVDFLQATEDSLRFAASQLSLPATDASVRQLVSAYSALAPWPDAAAVLARLRAAGLRLAFLSNMTAAMLTDGLRRASLTPLFDRVISTDTIRTYKPDPRAYALGTRILELAKEEILFVGFAGWDIAGSKWFGYPTFWTNRSGAPAERLSANADGVGPDLNSLVSFVHA